nr:MAG TPA: Ku70 repair protein, Protein-DNA interaction [Caudoviricetes sp.]
MNKDLRKALELIVSELSNGELVLTDVVKEAKDEVAEKRASKKDKKVEPKEEVKEDDTVETAEYSMEELKAMTQAELKALAKELGVSVRGSKSAILGRILEKIDVAEVEEEDEPVAEAEEPATEEVENDDDPIQEALEELELEDLADLCEQAELSTKGKKQALIARLMTAHNAGEIDLTDFFEEEDITDEVDEEIEEDAVDEMQIEEILEAQDLKTVKAIAKKLKIKVALKDKKPAIIEKIGQYNVEDVIEVLNDMGLIESADDEEEESEGVEMPKFEGSKKRIKACEACWKETMADLENGDIDEDDIREFFEDRFSGNKSELKKIAKKDWEDLAIEYAEIMANMFDDDGDDVEMQEPYMVDETPYCCGVPMKKVDDTHFLCEIDGEEVELEDEE